MVGSIIIIWAIILYVQGKCIQGIANELPKRNKPRAEDAQPKPEVLRADDIMRLSRIKYLKSIGFTDEELKEL